MPTRPASSHQGPPEASPPPQNAGGAGAPQALLLPEEAPPSPFTPTATARRLWGALLLKVTRARIQEKTI